MATVVAATSHHSVVLSTVASSWRLSRSASARISGSATTRLTEATQPLKNAERTVAMSAPPDSASVVEYSPDCSAEPKATISMNDRYSWRVSSTVRVPTQRRIASAMTTSPKTSMELATSWIAGSCRIAGCTAAAARDTAIGQNRRLERIISATASAHCGFHAVMLVSRMGCT